MPSLRAVRLQHLLTQGERAQRAGANIATVVRLENGASAQASTIRKLAAVLRVKLVSSWRLSQPTNLEPNKKPRTVGAAGARQITSQKGTDLQ